MTHWNVIFHPSSRQQQQQVAARALSYLAERSKLEGICYCLFSHERSGCFTGHDEELFCTQERRRKGRRRTIRDVLSTCQSRDSLVELVLSLLEKYTQMLNVLCCMFLKFTLLTSFRTQKHIFGWAAKYLYPCLKCMKFLNGCTQDTSQNSDHYAHICRVRWAHCICRSLAYRISHAGLCYHILGFPVHSALCFEVDPPVFTLKGSSAMFKKR